MIKITATLSLILLCLLSVHTSSYAQKTPKLDSTFSKTANNIIEALVSDDKEAFLRNFMALEEFILMLEMLGNTTSPGDAGQQWNYFIEKMERNYNFLIAKNKDPRFNWKDFKIEELQYETPEIKAFIKKVDVTVHGFVQEQQIDLKLVDLVSLNGRRWSLMDNIQFVIQDTPEQTDTLK